MTDDISQRISAEGADPLLFAGVNDSNLQELQRTLGVRISFRGDSVTVAGTAEQVERATLVVQGLIDLARIGEPFTPDDVYRLAADTPSADTSPATDGKIVLPGLRRAIAPKTQGQRDYLQAIANHDIVVSIGPAGTGKTYLAVAKAVEALARKRVKRIILARPAVEAGESLGFLPGDLQAKVDPYLRPLYDALEDMIPHDRVHLVTAHLTVTGAATGGGERDAHTVLGYAVPATVFPATAHYVALGHLHRAQRVAGPCPVRYSGSPLAVDFGEQENVPSVTMVEVTASTAARVREVPVTAASALRTVRGTLAQLAEIEAPDAWLRVYVREQPRAGLREEIQELLPRALEIRIDPELLAAPGSGARIAQRSGRSPRELFADYLDSRGHADEGVRELFDELFEEVDH